MPTPAEGLQSDSSEDVIRKAISATVSQLVGEGFDQDQAVAIALQQARKAVGKEVAPQQGGPRSAR